MQNSLVNKKWNQYLCEDGIEKSSLGITIFSSLGKPHDTYGDPWDRFPIPPSHSWILILFQLFETTGVQLMADSHYDAPTRIQELLEYLHEREVDLETLADSKRNRLEQCVQLRNFEVEARQVKNSTSHMRWI